MYCKFRKVQPAAAVWSDPYFQFGMIARFCAWSPSVLQSAKWTLDRENVNLRYFWPKRAFGWFWVTTHQQISNNSVTGLSSSNIQGAGSCWLNSFGCQQSATQSSPARLHIKSTLWAHINRQPPTSTINHQHQPAATNHQPIQHQRQPQTTKGMSAIVEKLRLTFSFFVSRIILR